MAFPHLNVFPGVTRKHSEQDRNIYVIYVYSMQNITNKRYLMTRGIISTEDGEFIQNQFTSWCGKPTGGIDQNTNLLIQFTIWGLVGWMNHTHKMAGLLRFYHIYEVSLYCMWPVVFPADFLLSCTFQSALHRRTVTWWACQNLACPWNGILRLPRTWLNESYQGWWWQAFCQGQTLHKVFCIFTVSRSLLQLTAFCHSWHLRQRWSKEKQHIHTYSKKIPHV